MLCFGILQCIDFYLCYNLQSPSLHNPSTMQPLCSDSTQYMTCYNVSILTYVTTFNPGRIHQPCGHFALTPLNTWHVTMYQYWPMLQRSIPAESINHAATLLWLHSIHDMLQCINTDLCYNVQSRQNPSAMWPLCSDSTQYMTCYNVSILTYVTTFNPGRIHQPCGHFALTLLNTWHVTMYQYWPMLQRSIPAESINHAATLLWLHSIHDMLQCINTDLCYNVQSRQNPSAMWPLCSDSTQYMTCYNVSILTYVTTFNPGRIHQPCGHFALTPLNTWHVTIYIMAGHAIVVVKDITLLFYHGNAVILTLWLWLNDGKWFVWCKFNYFNDHLWLVKNNNH